MRLALFAPPCLPMQLARPSEEAHVGRFMALEYEASRPYTDFAYASAAQAEDARRLLFEKGAAEYAPPYGKLLFAGDGEPAGMVACLTGADLKRQRMKSAMALSKAAFFEDDPALQGRLKEAGQALLRPEDGDFYLSRVAVHESARGRGLGTFLLERFEEEARARGCRRLALEVAPGNEAAVALYQRRGFEKLGVHRASDAASGRSLQYLHMAKTL